jgi:serpin B
MLAETAEGDSRQQILDLLGVSDLTALREKCNGLWNGVYLNDGAVTSLLANSLWLAEGDRWQYDMDKVNALAQHYYASTFEGEMGSAAYDAALQDWINEQTDNLLTEQAGDLGFDPNTVLALASTICFRAKWQDEFWADYNREGVFKTANGNVPVTYMTQSPMMYAYFGDRFTAVSKDLDDGAYKMTFFLPNEGVAVDDLVTDRQVLALMQGNDSAVASKFLKVNMSIPKFDVVADKDLADGLKKLGVTDVFDSAKGDFGGILTEQTAPLWVDEVQHAARVAIDEEGVTAAAYTVMQLSGSPMPQEEIDFTLDRPFMFAITGPENTILFTGVVENP